MFTASTLLKDQYIPDSKSTWIRPAGVLTSFNETAKDALTWKDRPSTPEEQKKYRQSTVHEPGKIVKHFGTADDPIPEGPFGNKTQSLPGENVAANIKSFPETEVARWKLERSEDVYASSKTEPLGHSMVRGHKIPGHLGNERPFGMIVGAKEKDLEGQVRNIMFPTDQQPEDEEHAHTMYVKSHAAFGPGEQRSRNYQWDATGFDPVTHRFGAVDKDDYQQGVKKALQPALDQTAQQPPKLANKVHEDFKAANTDLLGRPRKLGAGERAHLSEDHTFGMPSMRHGPEPGVDRLLQGAYSEAEQQPDADLGKSLREGWRNTTPEGRVFGIPSVRTDVALPKARSVANTINYGNEPDAFQLLRPPRSVERGVHEEHYMALRSKSEIRELVTESGIELTDEEFDVVFKMAQTADSEEEERCCLDTFFRARHHQLAKTIKVSMPC